MASYAEEPFRLEDARTARQSFRGVRHDLVLEMATGPRSATTAVFHQNTMHCVFVVVAGATDPQRRFMSELPEAWRDRTVPFYDASQHMDVLHVATVDDDEENIAPVDLFFGVET